MSFFRHTLDYEMGFLSANGDRRDSIKWDVEIMIGGETRVNIEGDMTTNKQTK